MSVDVEAGTRWIDRFARHGEREALCFESRSFGYAPLGAAAKAVGRRLRALGVEAGDIVAVLAPPSPAGVALIHAMLDQRIVLLPLSERFSKDELQQALTLAGARFLLRDRDRDDELGRVLAEATGCGLLRLAPHDDLCEIDLAIERAPESARAAAHAASRSRRLAERAALVLQTSGTSGRPKGAVLSFENLMASAEASARLLGAGADDRWLLCMPLFHIGGLSILVRSAASGASVVLQRRFDPDAVSRSLDSDRITRVSFVATMLAKLLALRGSRRAPATLSLVLLGGGPASQALLSHAHALGYPIAPTYGLTEATSQVATRPPGVAPDDEADLASGLIPLPGVELRIVDDRGLVVARGVEGEIEVRGPIVMRGYLDDPVATAKAMRDGWLATGDVGRLDRRGRLRVLDRRTDLIVSGGENVYPAEIESRLAEHPAVDEACVVGLADELFGARPIAFVVARAGRPVDPAELASFCRETLAGYKVPIDFIERTSLPRTASGKLLRRALTIEPGARPGADPLR